MNSIPYEFCKLDSIDLKVAQWIYYKCPHSLESYLHFIAFHTYMPKGISVDTKKVSIEIMEIHSTNPLIFKD